MRHLLSTYEIQQTRLFDKQITVLKMELNAYFGWKPKRGCKVKYVRNNKLLCTTRCPSACERFSPTNKHFNVICAFKATHQHYQIRS
ncbi:hypothetical protein Naga_100126g10 [Nannochloropsis gaditana]|uniref:Uncharacterized protein n=1 Tax=Nannochloropsis gaditana TaxID=72520 RepID=W7TPE9_9STRA|nr:hypothetical protein Naga_100126g10 [Nannochloropsis gaditana]